MNTQPKTSVAKDVFAYLLTFAMLYVGVISFMALLWQIINVQFPDPATFFYQSAYEILRNSIASLIVVWPVFLLMSRYIGRDIAAHPEKMDLWVRKWLTYFTIFVSAITMIVDMINLINSFLSGELSIRFTLKVLVVLVVAAAVFGYQFWELRRGAKEGAKQKKWMAAGSVTAMILGIGAAFYFVGSPTTARHIRLDDQRIQDLTTIQYELVNYWNRTDKVPMQLDELKDPLTGFQLPTDPETREPYGFEKTGDLSFKLCATFRRPSPPWIQDGVSRDPYAYPVMEPYGKLNESWIHDAGMQCFQRSIDPIRNKYPKTP